MKRLSNEEKVREYRVSNSEEVLTDIYYSNIGLLNEWATPYVESIPNAELEDLMSEAYFPLKRAVDTYSDNKGVKFSSYLYACVTQYFNGLYNKATRSKRFDGNYYMDSVEETLEKASTDGYGGVDSAFTVECDELSRVEIYKFIEDIGIQGKEKVVLDILMNGGDKMDVSHQLNIAPPSVTYYIKKINSKFNLAGYSFSL